MQKSFINDGAKSFINVNAKECYQSIQAMGGLLGGLLKIPLDFPQVLVDLVVVDLFVDVVVGKGHDLYAFAVEVVVEGVAEGLFDVEVLVGLLVGPLLVDLVRPASVFSQALPHRPPCLSLFVPNLHQIVRSRREDESLG